MRVLDERGYRTLIMNGQKSTDESVLKEKTETGIHGLFHISTLPQELCPRRAELEDSANQALTLIKRWRCTGEVEFTVRAIKHPYAAVGKERAHTMF